MGDETTASGEFVDKMRPLGAKDLWDTWVGNDDISTLAKIPLSVISFVGVGGYTEEEKNWDENLGKELKQFKESIGAEKFKEANTEFNENVKKKTEAVKNDDRYKKMTPAERQKVITKLNSVEKQKVFDKYEFVYEKEESTENEIVDELSE